MVPDLLVEQLRLGELDPETAAAVRARLEADGDARLEALEADDRAIRAAWPAARIVPQIQARLPRRRAWWPVIVPTVLAAAAAVVLLARPATVDSVAAVSSGAERAKGPLPPTLQIVRADEPGVLDEGALAVAGEEVQLRFAPRGAGHAVIVSVDGRGISTLHWPDTPEASTALPAGRQTITLNHAYELDDAPRFERFFLVTADEPLDPAALLEAAVSAGAEGDLERPADSASADFRLSKP